jgi:hypothetical protein
MSRHARSVTSRRRRLDALRDEVACPRSGGDLVEQLQEVVGRELDVLVLSVPASRHASGKGEPYSQTRYRFDRDGAA